MENREIIQCSLDYIEDNLKTDITARELAAAAGFSLFHYYRIFQEVIGMPVMQYVLRRRLANAIYEVSCGGKIIDVALSYGFDTHAGFFKAFRREHDCSPSQYLKKRTVTKPNKINLKQEAHIMITHKKITEMLTHWGMESEKITAFCYESCGIESDSSWTIGDHFILKSGTNLTALKQHISISKALAQSGLAAAVPVATIDGKDYLLDGDTYFCLTTRPGGKCLMAKELYDGDYCATAWHIGEIIGQLHALLKKYDSEIICNDSDLFETVSTWALPETKKAVDCPESFFTDYLETFAKLCPKLPKQVIQRDPHPSQMLINDTDKPGFTEFEASERNVRLFDPCYAATAILSESLEDGNTDKFNKWLEIYQNIILGYDSVCKLTQEEKQALPYVVFSIEMICFAYFNSVEKFAWLAEIDRKMWKLLYENRDRLKVE
jgi:AraC-like DNA-binding protein/Ser/Thr protein kinase RdoA (MazF antagonist)